MGNQMSPNDDANRLLRRLLSPYNPGYGLGHMSPSIYDTAWVSMVSKDGSWLFPSAFEYIVEQQAHSGAWESPSSSPIDTILNTLASLLALKVHNTDGQFDEPIERSTAFLSSCLNTWDVSSTDRVGFEITVPSMLNTLSKLGVEFSFPQHSLLMDLNRAKLTKIPPRVVYDLGTPLLHSLEGLVGHIDFDRVAHHKRQGSFMASPASTAAYLMNASAWDDECEGYLAAVLSRSEPHDEGSVPCAWPTTFFELSWIICTLHDVGIEVDALDPELVGTIRGVLKQGLDEGDGIVGFAASVAADADDSAKVITALSYLGVPTSVSALCHAFELDTHFQCYGFERNPSITVQCNVLSALLEVFDKSDGASSALNQSIYKVAAFISDTFWTTIGDLDDKWHTSGLYALLLIVQSLTRFMLLFDKGLFPGCPQLIVQTKAPVALFQILIRLLQAQDDNGSWGSCEETAYALLALVSLSSLPFTSIMIPTIQLALNSGRRFLSKNMIEQETSDKACLWIDKVNYRIPPLSYSYVFAALYATSTPVPGYSPSMTGEIDRLVLIPTQKANHFLHFYRKLPIYRECKDWQLLAYIAEGYLYLPALIDVSKSELGRTTVPRHMVVTPFAWTSANRLAKRYSSPQNCFFGMTFTVVLFEIDEFYDLTLRDEGPEVHSSLRRFLDDIFDALNEGKDVRDFERFATSYPAIFRDLHKYICFAVYYPAMQEASDYDQGHSRRELKACLVSMTQQNEDGIRYAAQTPGKRRLNVPASYMKWVRTVGSEHIAALTVGSSFICNLSRKTDVFQTPELKYIAQDCLTHIAVLARIWNDWSSMHRDITEFNINTVHFPEFSGLDEKQIKSEIERIAGYERKMMVISLQELRERAKKVVGERKGDACVDAFELFFRASEAYTAIYLYKDLGAAKLDGQTPL